MFDPNKDISLIQFLKLTNNLEDCENSNDSVKEELLELRREVVDLLDLFEQNEDIPKGMVSETHYKIQLAKKHL